MFQSIFPLPIFPVLILFGTSEKLNFQGKGFQSLLILIKIFNTDYQGLHFITKNLLLTSLRAMRKQEIQDYTSNGTV